MPRLKSKNLYGQDSDKQRPSPRTGLKVMAAVRVAARAPSTVGGGAFDIEVGHCAHCRRRVQGRHRLQTSDALGAASVQLGPEAIALVVRLHAHLGTPLAKVAHLLETQFGITVTPGGLSQVLHRTARQAAPSYAALCRQVRGSPVVTPDETGWRVGAVRHWLWAFATPTTTVYAICSGRGFNDAGL